MPKPILEKIQYLCKMIPKVEWSGILLYSVEGDITNPSEMIITLQDIIPMHKGTSGYTEYQFNEKKRDTSGYEDRHIDYVMENSEAEDWIVGHIHSHNTMQVFFSGTDNEELEDNSPCHNFYLSLIVNNFMDFTAKVAVHAKVETTLPATYFASNGKGELYSAFQQDLKIAKDVVLVYDCEINSPKVEVEVDKWFSDSVDAIIKKADEDDKKKKTNYGRGYGGHWNRGANWNTGGNESPELTEIEEMTILFLAGGLNHVNVSSVEDALNRLANITRNFNEDSIVALAKGLLKKYPAIFDKIFPPQGGQEDLTEFIMYTEQMCEILEDEQNNYNFISPILDELKELVIQCEFANEPTEQ